MKLIVSLLLLIASALSYAQNRTVLAIVDFTETPYDKADGNIIHTSAEMVFNYLGVKVRYHDISQGLPPEEKLDDVFGIISCLGDNIMKDPEQYCEWAKKQINAGKKYIVWGNLGASIDAKTKQMIPLSVINELFNAIGVEYAGSWTNNPFAIEIAYKDDKMLDFERAIEQEDINEYEKIISLSDENEVYLKLNRIDIPNGLSDVIVTTPQGGLILGNTGLFISMNNFKQWYIDPFSFFEKAFQLKDIPRYDTTTLFGKRIYYSHVDGDGFSNISLIDEKSPSVRFVLDEVFKKYELPITASIITAEIDPKYFGQQEYIKFSKEIFALDNIEAGVHGFTHPLDWERKLTVFSVSGYSRPTSAMSLEDMQIETESNYSSVAIITADWPDYIRSETIEALKYVQKLLPQNKQVKMVLWTGNCRPPGDAIDLVTKSGYFNINGGDSRFDKVSPSYTGVAPLTRQVGGAVQCYTSNSNENIYTNGWTGPFNGLIHVIDTFQQTEIPTLFKAPPRRVSPMNVYYHYYCGERKNALEALQKVYDYVEAQDMIPLFASEYVRGVQGFLSGTMSLQDDGGWHFKDYGYCRTVRLDDTKKYPDLAKSKNILGFTCWYDHLYIHLQETDDAVLYLTDMQPQEPYLEKASSILYKCEFNENKICFATRCFRDSTYNFVNMIPGATYSINVKDDVGKELFVKNCFADDQGNLELILPVKGNVLVEVNKNVN